jgi:hypothetical protein
LSSSAGIVAHDISHRAHSPIDPHPTLVLNRFSAKQEPCKPQYATDAASASTDAETPLRVLSLARVAATLLKLE